MARTIERHHKRPHCINIAVSKQGVTGYERKCQVVRKEGESHGDDGDALHSFRQTNITAVGERIAMSLLGHNVLRDCRRGQCCSAAAQGGVLCSILVKSQYIIY